MTWPFVAARLLWLLPFVTLGLVQGLARMRFRHWLAGAILLSFATSTAEYFRRENYMNHGYTAPLREISDRLNREISQGDVVLVDGYNTDSAALRFYLQPSVKLRTVLAEDARPRVESARTVFIVRNTHDVSPGQVMSAVEAEACRGRRREDVLYEPYAAWQRVAMRWILSAEPPEYFYRLSACQSM